MEKRIMTVEEKWEWILSYMVVEDLFVHKLLMMMEKVPKLYIGTMGVSVKDAKIIVEYSPQFVLEHDVEEIRFVLTHEIFHVLLHHCTKRSPLNPKDRKIFNIAYDMAINCLIPETASRKTPKYKKDIPEKGIQKGMTMGVYPADKKFPDRLSAEQYLLLLRDWMENKGGGRGNKSIGNGGDGGENDPLDDIPEMDSHDEWDESSVVDEVIRNTVDQISKDERAWGNVPGDIKELILAAQKSEIPWERYLKYHIGQLQHSSTTKTMKRPDRRFGYPYAGTMRGFIDKKLVAIDTSASVGSIELSKFLTEVNRLAEVQPVDLVLFDTKIQKGPVAFRKTQKMEFEGRGGTCFEPVFKLAQEKKYQSVIVLTDGEAGEVEYPKGVKDVLWVLVGESNPPVPWGVRVRIKTK